MSATARTTTRPPRLAGRPPALVLLAVLLGGLAIMSFTLGWIGALPLHDHLALGEHYHGPGVPPHAHDGDALARTRAALRTIETPATADGADGGRVVSLRSAGAAYFALSSAVFIAVAAALLGGAAPARGVRLAPATHLWPTDRLEAPPCRPPRPA